MHLWYPIQPIYRGVGSYIRFHGQLFVTACKALGLFECLYTAEAKCIQEPMYPITGCFLVAGTTHADMLNSLISMTPPL